MSIEERVQALEANVQDLSMVLLAAAGTERAWQLATLGLLGMIGSAPGVGSAIAELLETTHQTMLNAGAAQAHVESFCIAGRVILGKINLHAGPVEARSDVH